ncbi:MAG: helix-turn-helix transcriptional regulator [Oscillospiraceae bacterium]|nr:helix-turn-helix transcriptional regulator [Oscillospiraceae bacterium]
MNFSEKLKKFRLQNAYTQEEIAKLVGTDRASISRYENGLAIPDMYKAVKLAKIMKTTCEELVTDNLTERTDNYGQIT